VGSERHLSALAATDLARVHSGGQDLDAAAQLFTNLTTAQIAAQPTVVQSYRPAANAQTGTTYTLALTDNGLLVTLANASAITLTVPTNASVAFPVGAVIDLAQTGAGLVTISAAGGVTVSQIAGTLKMLGQYSVVRLRKTGTNTWLANGDLAAS
jgi:hypothetical protein